MAEPRFRAFFSYARADARQANALYRYLDGYKVPRSLVGTPTALGQVPQGLHPVFRDREDLTAGEALSTRIQQALSESEALVVLCSPAAARSLWVDQEVRGFLALGREGRIFPVIAECDPEASNPELECFPPALRGRGILSADLRHAMLPGGRMVGDGEEEGRLKLVSGLLGLPLDALRLREAQRRRRRQALMTGVTVVVLALAVLATMFALQARQSAQEALRERDRALANLSRVFLQRSWALVDNGAFWLATKYALAGRALSNATQDEQRVLLARLRFASGRPLSAWTLPHEAGAIALHPGGSGAVVVVDQRGQLSLWQPGRTTPLWQREQHQLAGSAVAFSPDGRTVWSGGADGVVRALSLDAGMAPLPDGQKLFEHDLPVKRIASSTDGHWLATYAEQMSPAVLQTEVKLWDARSGRQRWIWRAPGPVVNLAVDAPRQRVWIVLDGERRQLLALALGDGAPVLKRPLGTEGAVAIDAAADLVVSVAGKGALTGRKLSDGATRFERSLASQAPVVGLAIAGNVVTVLNEAGSLFFLKASNGGLMGSAVNVAPRALAVAVDHGGQLAATAGGPGALQTFAAGHMVAEWPADEGVLLAPEGDARRVAVIGASRAEWRELPSGRLSRQVRFQGAQRLPGDATIHPDTGALRVEWRDGVTVGVAPGALEARAASQAPTPGSPHVGVIALEPRGKRARSLSGQSVHIVVDGAGASLELRRDIPAHVGVLRFSPDGQRLAAATHRGDVMVWDLSSGRLVLDLPGEQGGFPLAMMRMDGGHVRQLAFDPPGRRLAYIRLDRQVLNVVEIDGGRVLAAIPTPSEAAEGVALAPDGRSVAASGAGGTFVHDIASGRLIAALDAPTTELLFAGSLLVTGGNVWVGPAGRSDARPTQVWDLSMLDSDASALARSLCDSPRGRILAQFTAEEAAADRLIADAWLDRSAATPTLCPDQGGPR